MVTRRHRRLNSALNRPVAFTYLVFISISASLVGAQESDGLDDQTIYQRISSYIIRHYVPEMDSSQVDSSKFHSTILDVYSTCDTSYLLYSFVYDDDGIGNRTIRALVTVFRTVDGKLEGCGYSKEGKASGGNFFVSGGRLYAEYTTQHGASGWSTEHYHLMQVTPIFEPNYFSHELYDHATVGEECTSYRFPKLLPDSTGTLTQALVWAVDLAQNWETHELLRRKDWIVSFALPESESLRDSVAPSNIDSMKTIFLKAKPAIRFKPHAADSLTQAGFRGPLASTKPFVSDSILSQRVMQIVMPHLVPALKNHSMAQISPDLRIENIRWTSYGLLYDVSVKLHWTAEYDLKFNVLDLKISDSCGILREVSLATQRIPSTGW